MVVATHKATVASSWLEIPNSGHSELIPPSGSFTPCQRKYPHDPTISALVAKMLGYQLVRPSGFQMCPRPSWSMKRPTRVPASRMVSMNNASNMMAKWYQSAISRSPPSECEKICAMPTANAGAPPVRLYKVFSPTAVASACMSPAVTGNPHELMVAAAVSGAVPTIPAGLLIAK